MFGRRRDQLRRGVVPDNGLDVLAVGLRRFEQSADDDLAKVAAGGSVFKAVRGEYGAGKTFFTRWLAERAKRLGFATAEVQVSETETPLHRMETVYRRLEDAGVTPILCVPWLIAGGLIFFLVVEAEKLVIRSSASLRSAVTAVEAGT